MRWDTVYGVNNAVASQQVLYIHADHLNTPRAMTDGTKKIVWKWESEAYGRGAPNADPDEDGVVARLDLRFPGQIADLETGLFYNMYRYCDPIVGRYTQGDPSGLVGGLNTYLYGLANPMSNTDFFGLDPFADAIKREMNRAADKGKFDFGIPDKCLPDGVCNKCAKAYMGACEFNFPCQNAAREFASYCPGLPAPGCSKQDQVNALLKLGCLLDSLINEEG